MASSTPAPPGTPPVPPTYKELEEQVAGLQTSVASLSKQRDDLEQKCDRYLNRMGEIQNSFKEVTPDDAKEDYDGLLYSIKSWVEDWTDRFIDDGQACDESIKRVRQNPAVVSDFKKLLAEFGDITNAISLGYSEVDQSLIIALVIRYLALKIFRTTLCGIMPDALFVIAEIEKSIPLTADKNSTLQFRTQLSSDIVTIRIWRAQTMNFLMAHADDKTARTNVIEGLLDQLYGFFKFIPTPGREKACRESIRTDLIEPAFKLHEKFMTSSVLYSLSAEDQLFSGARINPGLAMDKIDPLLKTLEYLDAHNQTPLTAATLTPKISIGQVRKDLLKLLTVRPGIIWSYALTGTNFEAPKLTYQASATVNWTPDEKKKKRQVPTEEQTWLRTAAFI
ncbi:Uu.00g142980.m01.CDS01 [Anthostomella pinea]|uniref:Uu.00g142980.m01.CDS01 n=1 Tax=Anthostomella pinea TaxID=933095 RepID=A0AAI8YLL1_9PEZI|nr:Uu.00g142980.m01.CDS01 [Anthostomella pinea]